MASLKTRWKRLSRLKRFAWLYGLGGCVWVFTPSLDTVFSERSAGGEWWVRALTFLLISLFAFPFAYLLSGASTLDEPEEQGDGE